MRSELRDIAAALAQLLALAVLVLACTCLFGSLHLQRKLNVRAVTQGQAVGVLAL